jgi:hypothetical protein
MPNNACIKQKTLGFCVTKSGNLVNVELGKGASKGFAFVKNRQPTQARLKTFKTDLRKQATVIVHRETPFMVVVALILWSGTAPDTAGYVLVIGE